MTKCIFLALCGAMFFQGSVQAQDSAIIDSLYEALHNKVGAERYHVLHNLAAAHVDFDNEKALEIAYQAEAVAILIGDSISIVRSNRLKSQVLSRLGRLEEVIPLFDEYYPIATKFGLQEECILISNTAGAAFTYRGQFDKALRCYFLAYKMAKDYPDTFHLSMILHNIGITYYKLKDYKKGLHYLESCLAMEDPQGTIAYFAHMNISLCHVYLNDFAKARLFLDRAVEICGSDCNKRDLIHIGYNSGSIHLGLKQYDSAEAELLTSYARSKESGDLRMQLDNIILLAEVCIKLNRLDEAVRFLAEGENLSRAGLPFNLEIIKIHKKISELYLSIQNFEKAALYQKKYITLRDSIYNEELTTSLMDIEAEFLETENEAKIAAKDVAILLKEQVINRQRLLNVVTIFLIVAILFVLVLLIKNYREKKSQNALLERKVAERTMELERSRDSLLRVNNEKDFRLRRLSLSVAETINTVTGLCSVCAFEVADSSAQAYVKRIHGVVDRFGVNYKMIVHDKLVASP